jgi:hypothetical protein
MKLLGDRYCKLVPGRVFGFSVVSQASAGVEVDECPIEKVTFRM